MMKSKRTLLCTNIIYKTQLLPNITLGCHFLTSVCVIVMAEDEIKLKKEAKAQDMYCSYATRKQTVSLRLPKQDKNYFNRNTILTLKEVEGKRNFFILVNHEIIFLIYLLEALQVRKLTSMEYVLGFWTPLSNPYFE